MTKGRCTELRNIARSREIYENCVAIYQNTAEIYEHSAQLFAEKQGVTGFRVGALGFARHEARQGFGLDTDDVSGKRGRFCAVFCYFLVCLRRSLGERRQVHTQAPDRLERRPLTASFTEPLTADRRATRRGAARVQRFGA